MQASLRELEEKDNTGDSVSFPLELWEQIHQFLTCLHDLLLHYCEQNTVIQWLTNLNSNIYNITSKKYKKYKAQIYRAQIFKILRLYHVSQIVKITV